MIKSTLLKFYGLNQAEFNKFSFLGAIFAFTIGVYWVLCPLRDSIFCTTACITNLPFARWVAFLIVIPLAMIYSLIVNNYKRHKIFYVLCAFYGFITLFFAYFLAHPVYGLNPANIDRLVLDSQAVSRHIEPWSRFLGWAFYIYVESFGAIMVVLFWSFAADTTKPQAAKSGFGLIAVGAQLGGVLGPLLVAMFVKNMGEAPLVFGSGIAIFIMGFMIALFMKIIPKDQLEGYGENQKNNQVRTGLLEGLKLLLVKPYLLSIFIIISFFEIINTIFYYRLTLLANNAYAGRALSFYLSNFGLWVNLLGLIFLLFGLNNLGRKLGILKSLLILPSLVAVIIVITYFKLGLWPVWIGNLLMRSLNYAFNQPIKEQLYIPTSQDVKYKAKAWTEMFGARGAKATGSMITSFSNVLTTDLFLGLITLISLGLVGVWVFAIFYVGRKYQSAIDSNNIAC